MHSVPESQILILSVPQFTRNTVQSMLLLSDQMNSMTKTSHLSKILFAEIQIIITRIKFKKFYDTPAYKWNGLRYEIVMSFK